MNKQVWIILSIFVLLVATMSNAEPVNLILKTPAEGAVISTYSTDFIYSFDQDATILNCSLIVDDEQKASRNAMIVQNNNKLSVEISAGTHTWYLKCYDDKFSEIISEKRSFIVDVGGEVTSGYKTIYNSNGLRSYAITPAPGQEAVTLPAIKGGEDIQVMINGKTYYLDIIKMGAYINTSFVDVKDRSSGKTYKMLVSDRVSFDFDGDKTNDVELELVSVERTVNAYFIVAPYPESAPAEQEEIPETPAEEPAETPTEMPEEAPAETETPPEEKPREEQPPATPPAEGAKQTNKTWLIILIIVVVIIILLIALLAGKGSNKKPKKKADKKIEEKKNIPAKKNIPTKPAKQEVGISIKKETKQDTKPETVPAKKEEEPAIKKEEAPSTPNPDEERPVVGEKFEIIKSTGRRGRK
ncbi:hypothetical protein JW756_01025 [Candidatus Woesearchaeota archaeon]|nr:hypothetical protein [Candidatus Woesearchaeota archaeon]